MNKQQEALKLALEALELYMRVEDIPWSQTEDAITAIREALAERKSGIKQVIELYDSPEQPTQHQYQSTADKCELTPVPAKGGLLPAQQQEPVANGLPLVIAGAIFDFAGYLTTRDTVIEVGSTANASPVADLVKDWAALRGLSLADAAVLSWQEWLTDVRANDTSKERVDEMQKQRHGTTPPQPASKPWVGLTNKDIYECEPKTDWYDSVEFGRAIETKLREKNA